MSEEEVRRGAADIAPIEPAVSLDRRDFEALRAGLNSTDEATAERSGDRLRRIASMRPELLIPYAEELAQLSAQASAHVRETSLDALAIIARIAPGTVAFLLPRLHAILATETTDLLRDRAIDILNLYARTSKQAAEKVFPILVEALDKYGTRNATRGLNALAQIVEIVPRFSREAITIAERYQSNLTGAISGAAKKLLEIASPKQE